MTPPVSEPVPPLAFDRPYAQLTEHLVSEKVDVTEELLAELAGCCALETDAASLAEHGRDWWPLSLHWALRGEVPSLPAVVARPKDASEVAALLRVCNRARLPVTPAGGRSGVCGGAVPVFGGLVVDCCELAPPLLVDDASLLVDVGAGMFGPELEATLRESHGLSLGHFPQSIELSTLGGWIACRGAGQYSTRYGKIEDMVAGLEVVLADGTVVRTGAMAGAGPRSAMGPDLTQIFVGSEGTLGLITAARLRVHPAPPAERRAAFGFPRFADGLEALRRTLRRGATPAVVRLYDAGESERNFELAGTALLIALDEGDPAVVEASISILSEESARAGASVLDEALVERWLTRRNDVSVLEAVTRAGIVVDTVEVAGPWSTLEALYDEAVDNLSGLDGCLAASAHQSHAYADGACLYFTFAGRSREQGDDRARDVAWAESFYERAWSALMAVTRRHGASISHHHGIGLVRAAYLPAALGNGFGVLAALKAALDPLGILNPGKLALPSPFGGSAWGAALK